MTIRYFPPRKPKTTRTWSYRKAAAQIKAAAKLCAICGHAFTPEDPAVCDHILPISEGGTDHPANLRALHRSCHGRRHQQRGERWMG